MSNQAVTKSFLLSGKARERDGLVRGSGSDSARIGGRGQLGNEAGLECELFETP